MATVPIFMSGHCEMCVLSRRVGNIANPQVDLIKILPSPGGVEIGDRSRSIDEVAIVEVVIIVES